MELAEAGVLDKYGVELIGAKIDAIKKAEDRLLFKDAMRKIGLETPQSQLVTTIEGGLGVRRSASAIPCILRPSFTMGGTGGGIAYNQEELVEILERGLDLSPVHEVLIEESALGWKEFELEVMRDLADNCIIVCSIENFDPMGVHTGDSITVAPAQTLTDREYQMMRDGALALPARNRRRYRRLQRAVRHQSAERPHGHHRDEPARLAQFGARIQGHRLPHRQDRRQARRGLPARRDPQRHHAKTPACFEPTIDYVVAKIPKWAFEKFPGADHTLGTQMKSVGEVMAIGRTFKEALWKGMRSLETGKAFGSEKFDKNLIAKKLITPTPDRLNYIRFAIASGYTVEEVHEMTSIDPWFLTQMKEVVEFEAQLAQAYPGPPSKADFPHRQALRNLRCADRQGLENGRNRRAQSPQRAGRESRLQPRRYLLRRIRKLHAVPLFQLRDAPAKLTPATARRS